MRQANFSGLLLALAACAAGTLYGASPGPIQFPILGLGLGQDLRLTAVATDGGLGCNATLGFVDLNGVQANPGPISKPVSLMAGHSDFLDFPASMVLTRFGQRLETRPQPVVSSSIAGAGGGTDCMFFAEIFDQPTGFSQVYAQPGPIQLPGGMVTFPLMGVAFGQVLRFTAVAVSPGPIGGPCNVQLGFVDANGAVLQPGGFTELRFTIGGGYVDIPSAGMVSRIGQRVLVRPVIMVSSADPAMPCLGVQSSAEIFDVSSGHTWSEGQPGPIS